MKNVSKVVFTLYPPVTHHAAPLAIAISLLATDKLKREIYFFWNSLTDHFAATDKLGKEIYFFEIVCLTISVYPIKQYVGNFIHRGFINVVRICISGNTIIHQQHMDDDAMYLVDCAPINP